MIARRGLLLALALSIAGCAALPTAFEAPNVTLSDITPEEIALLEQRFRVRIRIQNPNPEPLRLSGLSYRLEFNGKDFAKGVSDSKLEVPAFGSAVLETELISSMFALVEQLRLLQEDAARLRYRLDGTLHLSDGLLRRLPFEREGEIDLRPSSGGQLQHRSRQSGQVFQELHAQRPPPPSIPH